MHKWCGLDVKCPHRGTCLRRCWGSCRTFRRWSLVRIRGLGTGIQVYSSTLLLAHSLLPDYQCIMTVRLLFLPPCLPARTINKSKLFLKFLHFGHLITAMKKVTNATHEKHHGGFWFCAHVRDCHSVTTHS